jgi:hypothetical protein
VFDLLKRMPDRDAEKSVWSAKEELAASELEINLYYVDKNLNFMTKDRWNAPS